MTRGPYNIVETYSECHPDVPHYALGLCRPCWQRARYIPSPKPVVTCHPERKHRGQGLCEPCYVKAYQKQRYATSPEWRERCRLRRQAYYAAHKEQVKAKAREYHHEHYKNQPRRPRKPRRKAYRLPSVPFQDTPLVELPRETPRGACDMDWWKVTKKPKAWMMNT